MRRAALAASAATALVGTMLVGQASVSAAPNDTTRGYNGPASCITIDGSGKVTAPGPGDCAQFGKAGQGRTSDQARNVILIIGDGMGQQEITAARNYLKGASGRFQGIDELTSEGLYTHHSIDPDGKFNYVTESAASATAWSTGTKTYNGALAIQIDGKPVPNLIEKAKLAGMRTGNVSTSEIQDATPAAQGSHALNRKCYGPEIAKNSSCSSDTFKPQYRENGGLGSISEQLIETRADVTLGGGSASFDQNVVTAGAGRNPFLTAEAGQKQTTWVADKSVLANAKDNGFQVVNTAAELNAITAANQDNPVLGLFATGNMKTRNAPLVATPGGSAKDPASCKRQDTGTEPDLPVMMTKAIQLLDDPAAEKGFFLQVESASIDKSAHGADACGQIGETERLDEATKIALDFAKKDKKTLVVVTADHSHSTQILDDGAETMSATARLKTADQVPMTLGYGTIPAEEAGKGSEQHTGAQLRVAAYGPGEQNVIGQTDQTDTFYTISNALGINEAAAKAGATDQGLKKPVAAAKPLTTCYKVDSSGKVVAPGPGECAQYGTGGEKRSADQAKNVILFIGDGMGDSEITSARNYLYGANGRLPGVDAMRYTGSYTHYSLDKKTGKPYYVTESAASATGWSTGSKTYNGALSIKIDGTPVPNLIEKAKAKGMKTGNIATSEIQDATPAAQGSHALNRKCYGPEMAKNSSSCQGDAFKSQYRENGGLGSISEQLIDTRADLTLGGGKEAFEQTVQVSGTAGKTKWSAGKTVLANAQDNGFQLVSNKAELDKLSAANQDKPVLGLFAGGNMPRLFARTTPTLDGASVDPQSCKLNPERGADVPTIADMTKKALELLQNDKGFFIQVESASVDKADHDSDLCGQIGELDQLDQAVQVARDWVKKTGEPTLIIVTADHAHTSQIVANGTKTAGLVTKLTTADGAPMSVNYATGADPESALGGSTHTGGQVRIAAEGPSAQNVIGFTDQTDTHYTIVNALGLAADVPAGVPFTPDEEEPTTEPTTQPTQPQQPSEPPQPSEPGENKPPSLPSTGEGSQTTIGGLLVALVALTAMAALLSRRRTS